MKEKPIAFVSLVKLLEEAVGKDTSYTLLDPFPCTTLKDGRPSVIEIQKAGNTIAQHIGLTEYTFVITVTEQKPDTAAHIALDRSGPVVFIELSPYLCVSKDAVLATLCHELSHKFLHKHGIMNGATTLEQEFLTEVTAVYLGLGKIMLNGCEHKSSRQRSQDGQTWIDTETITVGYISRDCFAFVYRLICAMRGIPRGILLRGLSTAASEVIQATESKYLEWFSPEYCTTDGVAALGNSLVSLAETCQMEAATSYRSLRRIDERLRFVARSISESHKPLQKAQREVADLTEPEFNPHMRFLKCVQTRESILEALCRRDLQVKSVLSEWKQVEEIASLKHETTYKSTCEILECPIDGRKLRVPMGRSRLLVTCPACKYRFLVNTEHDATAFEAKQEMSSKARWKLKVIYSCVACFSLALLIAGSAAGQQSLQAGSVAGCVTFPCDTQGRPSPYYKTMHHTHVQVNHQTRINRQGLRTSSGSLFSTGASEPSDLKKYGDTV